MLAMFLTSACHTFQLPFSGSGSFFTRAAPFQVPELHWTDLQQSINDMPDNAPGMDGVKKSDLVVLSLSALWLLTCLLQAIEQGTPWPTPTAKVRTAYLSKGEDDLDPPKLQRACHPIEALQDVGVHPTGP